MVSCLKEYIGIYIHNLNYFLKTYTNIFSTLINEPKKSILIYMGPDFFFNHTSHLRRKKQQKQKQKQTSFKSI